MVVSAMLVARIEILARKRVLPFIVSLPFYFPMFVFLCDDLFRLLSGL
jgi:hypothetical protein